MNLQYFESRLSLHLVAVIAVVLAGVATNYLLLRRLLRASLRDIQRSMQEASRPES